MVHCVFECRGCAYFFWGLVRICLSGCVTVTYKLCLCVYVVLLCVWVPPLRSIDVVRFLGRGVGLGWRGVSLG